MTGWPGPDKPVVVTSEGRRAHRLLSCPALDGFGTQGPDLAGLDVVEYRDAGGRLPCGVCFTAGPGNQPMAIGRRALLDADPGEVP